MYLKNGGNNITLYRLNPDVRKLLAVPRGNLFPGPPEVSIPQAKLWMKSKRIDLFTTIPTKKTPIIICVGDVVSRAMLIDKELKKLVKYCFIDGETQRGKKIELPSDLRSIIIKKVNPRGMINEEIFDFLRKTMNDPLQYIVFIEGEEDLLVLPAVIEARKESFVFYGQPPLTDVIPPTPAGLVGIQCISELQKEYKEILKRFDKIE